MNKCLVRIWVDCENESKPLTLTLDFFTTTTLNILAINDSH